MVVQSGGILTLYQEILAKIFCIFYLLETFAKSPLPTSRTLNCLQIRADARSSHSTKIAHFRGIEDEPDFATPVSPRQKVSKFFARNS